MHLKLPKVLFEYTSTEGKDLFLEREKSAIHSGKLGDIIYALPTCRALGVTHLYLNLFLHSSDPLRSFSLDAAKSIVSLLLNQSYLRKISILHIPTRLEDCDSIEGIDYILDHFRRVAWQRVSKAYLNLETPYLQRKTGPYPAHLVEHFSSLFGLELDFQEPWLQVTPATKEKRDLVVSITKNWRSFPDRFWKELLAGFENVTFVGHALEFERARIPQCHFVPTEDALALARVIQSAKLFLGTVSFPYAVAEGLQVPRIVEPCVRNLNVFPLVNGHVFPSSIGKSRQLVCRYVDGGKSSAWNNFRAAGISLWNQLQLRFTPINSSRKKFLKTFLARSLSAR